MAADKLWKSTDISDWKKYLGAYEATLRFMAEKKKKKKLISLDNWYQSTLGKNIRSRKVPSVEKSELVKLMEWKLTRGKFRPRLTELIESNTEDKIKKISESSFKQIAKPDVAIKTLCELRGVGPATASAVLTVYKPEHFCFMADEAVNCVLAGKIDYTLKYYLEYLEKVRKKSEELSMHNDLWTPHDVECALWCSRLISMNNIPIFASDQPLQTKNLKRKSLCTQGDESGNDDDTSRSRKRKNQKS